MTYQEYKDKSQSEFNNLPIKFAFGMDQFRRVMEEWGLTENDKGQIYSLPGGGLYLRKDAEIIRDYFNKQDELPQLMNDYDFAFDAFVYEMGNHEYHINTYQGDLDVCSCFGNCEYDDEKDYADYLSEIGYSDQVIKAYKDAKKKFLELCNENDWW